MGGIETKWDSKENSIMVGIFDYNFPARGRVGNPRITAEIKVLGSVEE